MSRGINKVILVGNLARDPEIKYAASGNAIANITVCTSEQWNDKQTGERQEKTEYHRVVAFRRLAEIIGEYLKKGSQVYIEGKLQTRKWQDQEGNDRYSTEIVANDMQMLGGRPDAQNRNDRAQNGSGFRKPPAQSDRPTTYEDFADDDIPF